jgi:hypothetical protein
MKYRIFVGYDPRQPVAYNVCQHSIAVNASHPVSITPLILSQLPITRRGLTEFTFSRFLVPYLSDFKGISMFMDPDMIVAGDVCELIDNIDVAAGSVHVVKDQPLFEWPSMMVFSNTSCKRLKPDYVNNRENDLFTMDNWANGVGELPPEWNHCCSYAEPKEAKLYHFTAGLPIWPETMEMYQEKPVWDDAFRQAMSSVSYMELMGNSVHEQRRQQK